MAPRILFLDDQPIRHKEFARRFANAERVHVETFEEFEKALQGPRFDVMFLDHDLNDCQSGLMSSGTLKMRSYSVRWRTFPVDPSGFLNQQSEAISTSDSSSSLRYLSRLSRSFCRSSSGVFVRSSSSSFFQYPAGSPSLS